MEELRGIFVDRFVLSLINRKTIKRSHFKIKENKAVLLNEDGRKVFLESWHNKKQEKINHPYLQERISWGLVPYAQALLLARFLRDRKSTRLNSSHVAISYAVSCSIKRKEPQTIKYCVT